MTAAPALASAPNFPVWPDGPPDDETRCALCGEPLGNRDEGCVRGACVTRPQPERFYAVIRLCREYDQMILDNGIVHRFYVGDAPELSATASTR
jgi:hypothetical protein